MKSLSFLGTLLLIGSVHAANLATMTTPEATLKFETADGKPVAGVALAGMLGYKIISEEDCTGFICVKTEPHDKDKSEGGQVIGRTNEQGLLKVPSAEWSTDVETAHNLKVLFYVNGTIDVTCLEDGEQKFKGFVELLPQWINGKLVERDYECSSMNFRDGDKKIVDFKCKSSKTMEQVQTEISKIKEKCN